MNSIKIFNICYLCMSAMCICMSVHHVDLAPMVTRRMCNEFHGSGVTDVVSCHVAWESKPGILQEQPLLLIAEPSFQPHTFQFLLLLLFRV